MAFSELRAPQPLALRKAWDAGIQLMDDGVVSGTATNATRASLDLGALGMHWSAKAAPAAQAEREVQEQLPARFRPE